jgi:hypothetical protein
VNQKFLIPLAYFFLAFCGLGIPLAHSRLGAGLHGGMFQFLRDIGFLAWFLPVPAFLAGLLSLSFETFRSFEGVCFIAMAMFICASVDVLCCLTALCVAV